MILVIHYLDTATILLYTSRPYFALCLSLDIPRPLHLYDIWKIGLHNEVWPRKQRILIVHRIQLDDSLPLNKYCRAIRDDYGNFAQYHDSIFMWVKVCIESKRLLCVGWPALIWSEIWVANVLGHVIFRLTSSLSHETKTIDL